MSDVESPDLAALRQRLAAAEAALRDLHRGATGTIQSPFGALVVRTADAEAREAHIKQVLLAIRNVNQLLVSVEDPDELCRQACRLLTETVGYRGAWIARFEAGSSTIEGFYSAGLGQRAAALEELVRQPARRPECMRRALGAEAAVLVRDPLAECDGCPLAAGGSTAAALSRRLSFGEQIYGVLSVSLPRPFIDDDEERSLFDELAGDLAFALHKMEAARRHQETERDLARAGALALVGPWRFDLRTGIVTAPPETRAIYGLSEHEWTIQRVQEIPLPEYRAALDQALTALIQDGEPYDIEFEIRRPSDGAIRHIHSVAEYDAERQVVLGTLQDITERRQAERQVREREQYLEAILQTTVDGFWVLDQEGYLVEINESYSRMSGYASDELLGMHIAELDALEQPADSAAHIQRVIDQGSDVFETVHRRRDGTLWPVEVSVTWQAEPGGQLICFCRDLSERQQREERIGMLGDMLDAAPAAIMIHDAAGRIHFVNRAACAMHGYDEADFLAVSLQELDVPDSAAQIPARMREILARGEARFEVQHRRRDESVIPMEVHVKSIVWDGQPAMLSVGTDITERKASEQALRESERNYRQLVSTASDAIYLVNEGGWIVRSNDAAARMLNRELAEIETLTIAEIDPAVARAGGLEAFWRDTPPGQPLVFEAEHLRGDGSTVPVEVSATRFCSEGQMLYLGIARDISDRKAADLALAESRRAMEVLLENLPGIAYRCRNDESWTMSFVSQGCAELTGYDVSDLLQNRQVSFSDLIVPEDRQLVWDAVQAGVAQRSPFRVGYRTRTRDGLLKWVWEQGVALFDEHGDVEALEGFIADITERRTAEEALRESEELQSAIIAASPLAIVTVGLDGLVTSWNHAAEAIFGWAADEVLGRPVPLVPESELSASQAMRAQVMEGHAFSQVELTRQRKDGSPVEVSLSTAPVRDRDGAVVALVGMFEEITVRKQAEAALRDSEAHLRSVFRAAPIGIGMVTRRVLTAVNERVCEMTGYTAGELLGQVSRILYPSDEEFEYVGQAKYRQIAQAGMGSVETRWLTKDGREIDVLLSSTPLNHDDLDQGVVFTALDITDRKQAEAALRSQRARQDKMLANTGDVIVVIGADGLNHYKSPNIERWFGWRPEEVVGQPALGNVHPDDLAHAQAFIAELLQAPRQTRTTACRYRCRDGCYKWIEFTGTNLLDDADIGGILGNYHDISERKLAEAEQARLQQKLGEAQRLESIGRLAGGVAHDFNNMLNVIIGHADLMAQDLPLDNPLRSDVDEIHAAASRSADLTRQLLAFARRQTIAPKLLDLNETVESMLKMLRRLIGEDIELVWQAGSGLGMVRIDPAQVDQVLANLAVNARDALTDGGQLRIETSKHVCPPGKPPAGLDPGEYVVLAVSDNGCGMDADTKAMIFEPFFTTKEVGQGTGLGLATVFGIVSQNEGAIEVDSELGRGTSFRMYFPAHRAAAGDQVTELKRTEYEQGDETILLVEDEPAILRLSSKMLGRAGYTVLTAATPIEAVALAREHAGEINLLITDVVMPEMNGRELAQTLLAEHPGLRCLYMSGYTADVIARHGVLEEGVHFMQKPFSGHDLAAKVREVLDQP